MAPISPSGEVTSVEGGASVFNIAVQWRGPPPFCYHPSPLTLFMRTKWEQVIWASCGHCNSDLHLGSAPRSLCVRNPEGREGGRGVKRGLGRLLNLIIGLSCPPPRICPSPHPSPSPPCCPQAFSAELCLNYLHGLPRLVSVAQRLFAPVESP